MIHTEKTLVSATAMDGNINSTALQTLEYRSYSIQAVWSAGSTPVGTLKLQFSNDGGTTWTDLDGSEKAVSGNSGSEGWQGWCDFDQMRCVYTRTSGDGTLNVYAVAKE